MAATATLSIASIQTNGGLSKDAKVTVQQTVLKELNSTNTRQLINEELKRMGESITAMETDFATIRKLVLGIDEKNVLQDKFAPEWIRLHGILKEVQGVAEVFEDLVKKLMAMEGIWKMLLADARGLLRSLEDLKNETDDDILYDELYGEVTRQAYKVFAEELDAYSLAIAK